MTADFWANGFSKRATLKDVYFCLRDVLQFWCFALSIFCNNLIFKTFIFYKELLSFSPIEQILKELALKPVIFKDHWSGSLHKW